MEQVCSRGLRCTWVGTQVAVDPIYACRTCVPCGASMSHLCERAVALLTDLSLS